MSPINNDEVVEEKSREFLNSPTLENMNGLLKQATEKAKRIDPDFESKYVDTEDNAEKYNYEDHFFILMEMTEKHLLVKLYFEQRETNGILLDIKSLLESIT